jgi:YD repeat-containing protein
MKISLRIRNYAFADLLIALVVAMAMPVVMAQQGGTAHYTYDDNGRLHTVTFPNGETVVYNYDAASNLVSITRQSAPVPTIIGFNPTIATPGTPVSVAGTNFNANAANNQVTFNGTTATVNSATATNLATSVPAAAGSGHLAVTTPGGRAVSLADFFVPPPPYTAADVEYADRMAVGQNKTVTVNTAGRIALIVFDGVAGQHIGLTASSIGIPSSKLTLYNPDGTLFVAPVTVVPPALSAVAPVLPATGTYTILVDPDSSLTGSLTLLLAELADVTGTIAINGPPVTATTTTLGQNIMLTFSGTAGQHVSLTISDNHIAVSNLYIYKPNATTLLSATPADVAAGFLEATLPVSGTYTLLIDPAEIVIGSLTLTLAGIVDVSATITVGGPAVTITTTAPGQNAELTFSSTSGQKLNITLSSNTFSAGALSVYNPDGTALLTASAVPTTGGQIALPSLPATGTYTILLDPQGKATGALTLALAEVASEVIVPITPDGPALTVALGTAGQATKLTFNGTAGQRVGVLINATREYAFSIYNPDGTTLYQLGNRPTGTFFADPINITPLPANGAYIIQLVALNSSAGSATLNLYNVMDIHGTIAPGQTVTTVITTPGQDAYYTFNGTAGQVVSVLVNTWAISGSGSVILARPDATTLATASGITGTFLDARALPVTGTYTLRIAPFFQATGIASVTLFDASEVTATIAPNSTPVTVTTTSPGQNMRLTFSGTAGQRVSLDVNWPYLAGGSLTIFNPDGTQLARTSLSGFPVIRTTSLPATGTYTILVNPSGAAVGSITLTLNDIPPDVVGAIVVEGPPFIVTFNVLGQSALVTVDATAGQPLTVHFAGNSMGCPAVLLVSPTGAVLGSASSACGASFDLPGVASPATGTYKIIVNSDGSNTGSIHVSVTSP